MGQAPYHVVQLGTVPEQHEEGQEAQVDARGGRLPRVPGHVQAVHELSAGDGTLELAGEEAHGGWEDARVSLATACGAWGPSGLKGS